ncbi:S8 family serine peptidase [Bacillus sp. FJAT-49736]|uniref:S8 family peptidase n=1 Tax=Bacillus sp. FJAT-49736 TaxID=2833582 RepID=UPI001BC917A5|nr:S8 family serine peptidase [Bacillus sp. FJAT-49736]MBS4173081.1 S8 family serine peptidase [Bacillus sp. FJAT-49736]
MLKKLLYSFFVCLLIFSIYSPTSKAAASKDRVIVVFKNKIDKKMIHQANGNINQSFKNVSAVSISIPKENIGAIKNNKNVLAVEQDKMVKITGQLVNWGIKDINAPLSWKSKYTGKGIKIAVLDTGISKHEDLEVSGGASFVSYTKSFNDDNGHGTHVAGIIGAKNNTIGVVGVAPDASLYAVKVLDSEGSGYVSDIISGIDWAIKNQMDIINLSFGTPEDSVALQKIADEAYNKGILIVAAAGNGGHSTGAGDTMEYPAKYKSVIGVGAVDQNNIRGSFSATGSNLEVVAPGINIVSTFLNNDYAFMSGTSMAAPFVSGTLALIKQANPSLTNTQIREQLDHSAIDIGVRGKDNLYGFGLVQTPYMTPVQGNTANQSKSESVKVQDTKKIGKKLEKKTFSTKISTYKNVYRAGNTVWITTKVIDTSTKKPISKASMNLIIDSPKGKIKSIKAITNSNGFASFKMNTKQSFTKGNYQLKTTVKKDGYTTGYSAKTIKLK